MRKGFNLINLHERLPLQAIMADVDRNGPIVSLAGGLESIVRQKDMYESPAGYLKWETHFQICVSHLSKTVMNAAAATTNAEEYFAARTCIRAVTTKAPARYISKEICEAFINTSIPETGREVAEIFPALHILLPRNYLLDWEGCEITSLIIDSEVIRPEEEEEKQFSRKTKGFLSSLTGVYSPPENLRNTPVFHIVAITPTGLITNSYMGGEGAALNKNFASPIETRRSVYEKIRRIAVNSLLIHLHEPDLVTVDASMPRRSGQGFGKPRNCEAPLPTAWIGKTFRYQRDNPGNPGTSRGEVRSHWRRGHWHTVLHGKQKAQRRTQWFKPVYVGGK